MFYSPSSVTCNETVGKYYDVNRGGGCYRKILDDCEKGVGPKVVIQKPWKEDRADPFPDNFKREIKRVRRRHVN